MKRSLALGKLFKNTRMHCSVLSPKFVAWRIFIIYSVVSERIWRDSGLILRITCNIFPVEFSLLQQGFGSRLIVSGFNKTRVVLFLEGRVNHDSATGTVLELLNLFNRSLHSDLWSSTWSRMHSAPQQRWLRTKTKTTPHLKQRSFFAKNMTCSERKSRLTLPRTWDHLQRHIHSSENFLALRKLTLTAQTQRFWRSLLWMWICGLNFGGNSLDDLGKQLANIFCGV